MCTSLSAAKRYPVFYCVLTLLTGVAQVLNRLDGKPFDDADQRLFEVLFLTLLFFDPPGGVEHP